MFWASRVKAKMEAMYEIDALDLGAPCLGMLLDGLDRRRRLHFG